MSRGKQSIEAKRKKRSRLRKKKREKARIIKQSEVNLPVSLPLTPSNSFEQTQDYPLQDSHQDLSVISTKVKTWLECPMNDFTAKECAETSASGDVEVVGSHSTPSEYPGDHRFDEMFVEEEISNLKEAQEWKKLKEQYSSYQDICPYFVQKKDDRAQSINLLC